MPSNDGTARNALLNEIRKGGFKLKPVPKTISDPTFTPRHSQSKSDVQSTATTTPSASNTSNKINQKPQPTQQTTKNAAVQRQTSKIILPPPPPPPAPPLPMEWIEPLTQQQNKIVTNVAKNTEDKQELLQTMAHSQDRSQDYDKLLRANNMVGEKSATPSSTNTQVGNASQQRDAATDVNGSNMKFRNALRHVVHTQNKSQPDNSDIVKPAYHANTEDPYFKNWEKNVRQKGYVEGKTGVKIPIGPKTTESEMLALFVSTTGVTSTDQKYYYRLPKQTQPAQAATADSRTPYRSGITTSRGPLSSLDSRIHITQALHQTNPSTRAGTQVDMAVQTEPHSEQARSMSTPQYRRQHSLGTHSSGELKPSSWNSRIRPTSSLHQTNPSTRVGKQVDMAVQTEPHSEQARSMSTPQYRRHHLVGPHSSGDTRINKTDPYYKTGNKSIDDKQLRSLQSIDDGVNSLARSIVNPLPPAQNNSKAPSTRSRSCG